MSKKNTPSSDTSPLSFEEALLQIESILETMNEGSCSLEESLSHFETADKLIHQCQNQLQEAEKKVEILLKGKNGELLLDDQGKPKKEPFSNSESSFSA